MDENGERGVSDLQPIDDGSGPVERERPISPDMILSAVANEHRRAILYSLDGAPDGTVEYDALEASVAEMVGGEHAEGASDERRRRIRIALHHCHLPKLLDARIIDYDAETGHVQFVGGELERDILPLVEAYDADE